MGTVKRVGASFGVTDLRWFNLRDNITGGSAFAEESGLLTDSYRRKPAFSAYRRLIDRVGVAASATEGGISSAAADVPDLHKRARRAQR